MFRRVGGITTREEEGAGESAIRNETGTMEGGAGVGIMTGITLIDEGSMIGRDRVCAGHHILHVKVRLRPKA